MKLKELKQMIKEEYALFLEQEAMTGAMPPAPMGGAPSIDVGPDDINAMEQDPESTLRSIFDMLKDYFEPKSGDMAADIDMMPDMGDDMGDDIGMDAPKADKPAPKAPKADKPAPKAPKADKKDDKKDDDKKDDKDDKDDKKDELKERFQKLANIIKG